MYVPTTPASACRAGEHTHGDHGPVAGERPLSVLVVSGAFNTGLIEEAVLKLATRLAASGLRVRIVTGAGTGASQLQATGIHHRVLGCQSAPPHSSRTGVYGLARGILDDLLSDTVDVIQATCVRSSYAAALAVFGQSVCRPQSSEPALVTLLSGRVQPDLPHAVRRLRRLSDAIVLATPEGEATLTRSCYPQARLHVLPDISADITMLKNIYSDARAHRARHTDIGLPYEF